MKPKAPNEMKEESWQRIGIKLVLSIIILVIGLKLIGIGLCKFWGFMC